MVSRLGQCFIHLTGAVPGWVSFVKCKKVEIIKLTIVLAKKKGGLRSILTLLLDRVEIFLISRPSPPVPSFSRVVGSESMYGQNNLPDYSKSKSG
jgi:hypothetical protein